MKRRVLFLALILASTATVAEAKPISPAPDPTPAPSLTTFNDGFAVTYSSQADFSAANPGAVSDGFDITPTSDPSAFPLGDKQFSSGSYNDGLGMTFGAPTTGSVVNLNILDTTYVNGSNIINTKFGSDVLTTNYEDLVINFAAPVNAFAIDFAALARAFTNLTSQDTFSFTIDGEGTQQVLAATSGLTFFGFDSTAAFSSITISETGGNNRYFDNAQFVNAPAVAVPEPSTWTLLFAGFAGIAATTYFARRNTKTPAA